MLVDNRAFKIFFSALGTACLGVVLMASPNAAVAQIRIGTVRATVFDPSGAVVPGASVTVENLVTGFRVHAETNDHGECLFDNVPFDHYSLRIVAAGFKPDVRAIMVDSNLPMDLKVNLDPAGAAESVTVDSGSLLTGADSASTETQITQRTIGTAPGITDDGKLQRIIATVPGVVPENDGLLHIRAVDDGILYVIDGIPAPDRIDAVNASPREVDGIESITVLTGNIPAEFGGRSAAVVIIQPKSGIDLPTSGSITGSDGSFHSAETEGEIAGNIDRTLGYFVTVAGNRSDRFLSPVDLGNYHNYGGSVQTSGRFDWHPTVNDILLFSLSDDGSEFQEPNNLMQQEAGQDQRQHLRDNSQSVMWQHTWSPETVSNVAFYRTYFQAELLPSPFDIPLMASQNRKDPRLGLLASVTHFFRGHTLKAGAEGDRLSPNEFFEFAVTNVAAANVAEISRPALAFTVQHPFIFQDRTVRGRAAAYVQDAFQPLAHLKVEAGIRYDYSNLLVSGYQFSPRIGAVYYVTKTKTAFRASFNRLFMPPQVENLLLASSEQARQLSPFATGPSGGGSAVSPERTSAYEVGFVQDIAGIVRLDTAVWWRNIRDIEDPNVLFNTTIIFPNSEASAFSHGVNVRLDTKQKKGWSGYVSYQNSIITSVGPLNGGLFLTDDFIDIGPGVKFIPDHDERNEGAAGVIYSPNRGQWWASFSGQYNSGVPVDIDPDSIAQLMAMPNSDLVNFNRGRIKPWSVFNFTSGTTVKREAPVSLSPEFEVDNVFNKRFAYNFGNPFSGTHFGYPRSYGVRLRLNFGSTDSK
ncbi:MAG TPA: TonB-dependent receptor [Blastocatellia bacterium]